MLKPPDIALIGYAGAGKSTIAEHLKTHLGYTRVSMADPLKDMARAILGREINKGTDRGLLQKLGTDVARNPGFASVSEALDHPEAPVRNRRQWFAALAVVTEMLGSHPTGQDAAERVDPWWDAVRRTHAFLYSGDKPFARDFGEHDFWANKAADWLAARKPSDGPVVFDDVRFPNERERLKAMGVTIVRVSVHLGMARDRVTQRDGNADPAMYEHPSETWHLQMEADATILGVGALESNVNHLLRMLHYVPAA